MVAVSADRTATFHALMSNLPAVLAPMEDVSDAVFRRICRSYGAHLCVTEFVNVEGLLRGCKIAKRKLALDADDQPTAVQIYGADADRLAEAAEVAGDTDPVFLDINCGCWVPKVAGRGAGAGWLKQPDAMVAMASMVVARVHVPVTVKTRIGWDAGAEMPIVDIAKRLQDVGVAAIFLHCRTAKMGHTGKADWSWAARVRERVSIPVIVNGDVDSAEAARFAIDSTGAAGVMIGRRAIEHPWVFREVRAYLDHGILLDPPTVFERLDLTRIHFAANVAQRGEPFGVHCTRRHLPGYLHGLRGGALLRKKLNLTESLAGCIEVLDRAEDLYRRTGVLEISGEAS
jgi:nifR3 family TIM-barrel protein